MNSMIFFIFFSLIQWSSFLISLYGQFHYLISTFQIIIEELNHQLGIQVFDKFYGKFTKQLDKLLLSLADDSILHINNDLI